MSQAKFEIKIHQKIVMKKVRLETNTQYMYVDANKRNKHSTNIKLILSNNYLS